MFDKERFIEECRAAAKEHEATAAIRELVTKAVSDGARNSYTSWVSRCARVSRRSTAART